MYCTVHDAHLTVQYHAVAMGTGCGHVVLYVLHLHIVREGRGRGERGGRIERREEGMRRGRKREWRERRRTKGKRRGRQEGGGGGVIHIHVQCT